MDDEQHLGPGLPDGVDDDPRRLLRFARDQHRAEVAAQRDVFLAAAAWADLHSEDSITDAHWHAGGDTAKPVAGAGCPLVAEFAIAEFAAVLGRSTDSGRRLIGQAVECRHRLPRLWAQVLTGRVPAWRAGRVADATMPLSPDAAAWVDTQVAFCAAKIGDAQLSRLIGEAIARYDPALAEKDRAAQADQRRFDIRLGQTGPTGTVTGGAGLPGTQGLVHVDGVLDYADARDLEQAIRHGAADLAALGSTQPLDVRRSQAAGVLARRDLTLDLNPHPDTSTSTSTDVEPRPEPNQGRPPRRQPQPAPEPPTPGPFVRPVRPVKPRQVVIYAHLTADALTGSRSETSPATGGDHSGSGYHLARVEGHGWVTADQVRAWCGTDTQVTLTPVIDTTDCISVHAYEIPDRLRHQITTRDPVCVFPWCTRPARTADCDHITPHADGGRTCSCNLAPLCRSHHRLKTHTTWTYDVLDAGAAYLWVSPHGHHLHRDHTGTTPLDPRRGCHPPTETPPDSSAPDP